MSDNKEYYYMRLKENFFDEPTLKIIEGKPDGYKYSNILLKLYLTSLRDNGRLMLNGTIPYDINMISSVTGHDESTCMAAMKMFENMGLVEILDSGAIYMLNIQNFIGKTTTKADRQREYDRRIAEEKESGRNLPEICQKSAPEIEIEIETELETELEIEEKHKASIDYQKIVDLFNTICISYPRVKSLSEDRKKTIRARLNTYSLDDIQTVFEKAEASNFLKGKNGRDWSATFDWLLKDKNIAKVLDGNFDNKENEDPFAKYGI